MDKDMLHFLFVGPLYAIYKALNQIYDLAKDIRVISRNNGKAIMGLREDLTTLIGRVDAVNTTQNTTTAALRGDFQRLTDALNNQTPPVTDDVSDLVTSLGNSISTLEGNTTQLSDLDAANEPPATTPPVDTTPPTDTGDGSTPVDTTPPADDTVIPGN